MNRTQLLGVLLGLYVWMPCQGVVAEIVDLQGKVKAVDPDARTISIERKTATGSKTLDLEVNKKAGDLTTLKAGDAISFSYDPELELVTKIAAESATGSGGGPPRGEPITLIQPNSLDGWQFEKPVDEPNWVVSEGVLICTGDGPSLRSTAEFKDFELAGEFLLPAKGNSGILFGPEKKHEFALLDSLWRNSRDEQPRPDERTGAIYGKTAPLEDAYLGPNKWNRFVLTVRGNAVSATVNGRHVLKNAQLGAEQGASSGAAAPLVLQRHGATIGMKFRNLAITPMSDQ